MAIEKTQDEINEMENRCYDERGNPTRRWPMQSYEEGVVAALLWVTGQSDEEPIEAGS